MPTDTQSPLRRWFFHFGLLVIAALPLLIYEITALVFRKTPTITEDTREFLHKTWYIHLLFILGWALLTTHFIASWP